MKKIILASNSPRRKELLAGLDMDFEVRVIQGIDESYPPKTPVLQIAEYISQKKAQAYDIGSDEILLTADTVVIVDGQVMGKPISTIDAYNKLCQLSDRTHQVVTGCTLKTSQQEQHFSVVTDVTFKKLSAEEIYYYINKYKPFDKAGSYGIQEWIGYIGVTSISGSYYNVMGLPVQRIYEVIQHML